MRRWIFFGLALVLALGLCELVVSLAARVSPRVEYLLTPPWRRISVEDPILGVRGSAYAPGHDANGFRNPRLPDRVDVLAVGDSMTYGYAASPEESWPRQLERLTGRSVYNMSFGGYCPWQYELLIEEGLELDPEWVVIGLFVGNEFSESYRDIWLRERAPVYRPGDPHIALAIERADAEETLADQAARLIGGGEATGPVEKAGSIREWISERSALYGLVRELRTTLAGERWDNQRRDSFEAASARPHRLVFDARPELRTVFLRPEALGMRVDFDDPRIREGKRIVESVLQTVSERLDAEGRRLAVVLIPSKQVVYANLIRQTDAVMGDAFWEAVFKEQVLTAEVQDFLDEGGFLSVNATAALRGRFDAGEAPYPEWDDEHPNGVGYGAIAEAVAALIEE